MTKTARLNHPWAWVHTVGGLHCKKTGPGWSSKKERALWAWLETSGGERLFSRRSEDRIPVEPGASFRGSLSFTFKDKEEK